MRGLIVVCLLALAVQQGYALQCYSCASADDSKNCGEPFNSTSIPTCTLDIEATCMKTKIVLGDGEGNEKTIISRACISTLAGNPCDVFSSEQGNFAKVIYCSTCNHTDLCNSGPKSAVVSVFGLVSLVMIALKNVL